MIAEISNSLACLLRPGARLLREKGKITALARLTASTITHKLNSRHLITW
ncbi:hypothetical protein HMPREF0201_02214 [Cedecea davisae DSM 4568]|uniref:Uncharacterized protein n=1 Tax=Cedecea davisae DSM 4568 TaxID=566551 RepID=S3JV05_9ENTR|nr:hypothetical protein HMPREF0201_02214 [Cedecea davisae DSM 4568]